MIDLHCHMLPGIDDGAANLNESLAMAMAAVADGIEVTACTPHIYPGLYDNQGSGIRLAREALQRELDGRGIALRLVDGADTHLVPGLVGGIREGRIPTLNGSRYLLLEPPHHVAPPRFEESVFELIAHGYVPVLTHPERLTWVGTHYEAFCRLALHGAWIQVTAAALTGGFGRPARYWGERFLDDGMVHILATDAHDQQRRVACLSGGREVAARRVGAVEANNMVQIRPAGILQDRAPGELPAILAAQVGWQSTHRKNSFWKRWFGRHRA